MDISSNLYFNLQSNLLDFQLQDSLEMHGHDQPLWTEGFFWQQQWQRHPARWRFVLRQIRRCWHRGSEPPPQLCFHGLYPHSSRTSPSPLLRHGGRHTSSSLPFCSAAPSCVSPSGSCCTRNRIHICMSHRNTTRKVRTHMNTSGWRGSQMAQRTLAPAYDAWAQTIGVNLSYTTVDHRATPIKKTQTNEWFSMIFQWLFNDFQWYFSDFPMIFQWTKYAYKPYAYAM